MKNKEIKIGSKVIIHSHKYSGLVNEHIGIVNDIVNIDNAYSNRIGVSVSDFYNTNSIKGYYYFNPSELEVIYEEDEYKYIDAIQTRVYRYLPFPEKLEIDSLAIKDVIFNDPATIILWKDGTKTVVKCSENDEYDPEKGMAMAICKKVLGNKGNYHNTFSKWIPKEETSVVDLFNALLEKYGIKTSSEPKLITYREYVKKKYPEKCSSASYGGIVACPGSYVKNGPRSSDFDCKLMIGGDKNNCTKCFDQIIPLGSVDAKTGKPIYEEENK